MPAALTLPLALRFPRRPLFALLHQALANCLLGPYPTYGDIALWLVREGRDSRVPFLCAPAILAPCALFRR